MQGLDSLKESSQLHGFVHGRVQGVFFRKFVDRKAKELSLTGWVRNLSSGATVEIVAQGHKYSLQALIKSLYAGPSGAYVERVEVRWENPDRSQLVFRIK